MIGEIAMKPKAPKDLPAKSPVNVKGGKLVANDNITLLRAHLSGGRSRSSAT